MNTHRHIPRLIAVVLLAVILLLLATLPAAAAERVGTYDSRLVAFAAFWDEGEQARLLALKQAAQAARQSGDTDRYTSLANRLAARQRELHMQVFSTAPIDSVLAGLAERLPALQREAGVSRLVSAWDEAALAGVPAADRVDVTDRLIREFHLPAARLKPLEQLRSATPVPLWRARLMSWLHLF